MLPQISLVDKADLSGVNTTAARAGGDLWESWTEAKAQSSAVHPALIAVATRLLSEVEYEGTELVGNSLAEHFGWTEDTSQGGFRNRHRRGFGFLQHDGSPWGGYQWDGSSLDSEGKPTNILKRATPGSSRLYRAPVPEEICAKIAARHNLPQAPVADFWDWVADTPAAPLVLTEAGLKAMCALSQGYISVGVNGCQGAIVSSERAPDFPHGRLDMELATLVQGRPVFLAFDADWDTNPTVWRAVDRTATLLGHAGATVKICVWDSGLGKGLDDLIAGHGVEAFRPEAALSHGDWCRLHPRPGSVIELGTGEEVARALAPTLEAVELFPQYLGALIDEHATAMGIGADGIIGTLLPAIGSLIPNTWALEFGEGDGHGFTNGPTLWTAIVADSGQKKTPAMNAAIAPLERLQTSAFEDYAIRQKHYKEELARATAQQKKGRDGVMEPPPDAPDLRIYLLSEGTLEGVVQAASAPPNRRGFLQFRDELAGWVQSMNQYSKGSERQQWLQLAGQKNVIRVIKSEPVRTLTRPNICLTGGIQPAVLERLRGGDADGLWARFLYFRMPRAKYTPPGASTVAKLLSLELERIYRALDNLPQAPALFTVNPETNAEGYELLNATFRRWDELTVPGSGTAAIFSKAPGRVGTVALILHCLESVASGGNPVGRIVTTATIARAIAIVKYSLAQAVAQSVESDGEVSHETDEAMGLALTLSRKSWASGQEGWVSPRDLQRSRNSLRSADAKAVLIAMAEAGKGEIRSTARSCQWRIVEAMA